MSQRKMWDENQDQMIRKIVEQNISRKQNEKWKWSQIAQQLQNKINGCVRTGKQCRQRWYNHLNPTIAKDKQLSKQQIYKLFQLQSKLGNKWSIIAKQFNGRTDSTLKNFFYSSLRRAIRQINVYICQNKKKTNTKQFKQVILSKILKINDLKYRQKLNIKNQKVKQLAKNIKEMLAKLSLEEQSKQLTANDRQFRDQLVEDIQEFNKNCKKKKQKKVQSYQQPYLNDASPDQEYNFHDTSSEQPRVFKPTNQRIQNRKKQQVKLELNEDYEQKKNKMINKNKIVSKNKEIKQIKKQQQFQYDTQKQLFCNPMFDRKKSQIEQLQQQNAYFKILSQNSDFFKKSSFSCGEYEPLRLLTRKSSCQDKGHDFISTLENWKKAQSKNEYGLFQSYVTHDLIEPSLLESINLGENLPKINQNSTNQSWFTKLLKTDSKTEQGNAS